MLKARKKIFQCNYSFLYNAPKPYLTIQKQFFFIAVCSSSMAAPSAADIINATIATVTSVATEAAAVAVEAATTKGPTFLVQVKEQSAAALAMEPIISHVGDGIFLQTKTAQGIAGAFVWVALFLTCQQVSTENLFKPHPNGMLRYVCTSLVDSSYIL